MSKESKGKVLTEMKDNVKPNPQVKEKAKKTLGNTTSSGAKKNVKDIKFWGNGDAFRLISKAYSNSEGWMKSTKAMEIKGVGCVVQVTTQHGDRIAEALTFVPNTRIEETNGKNGSVISREIVRTV